MQRIADFLAYLSVEKGVSPHTLAAYKNDLHQFAALLVEKHAAESQPGVIQWAAIRKAQLLDYALYLREREYSTSTVARKTASVRSYFHFLTAEGVCREDPSFSLDTPHVARRLPHVLSVEQVARLLAQPALMPPAEALRDALMFHLVFDGELHVGELVALNLDDTDIEEGRLHYHVSDDLGRTVLLGERATAALRDYVQTGRPALLGDADPPESALFVNDRGNRITEAGFWLLVSRHAEAKRDQAMLELLYATGMRASELVSLNVQDVNMAAGYARCMGKGQKERLIPIHQEAIEVLETYQTEGRPQLLKEANADGADADALFVNNRGGRLTRQGLWLVIKRHARSIGIEDQVTPHTLRHSFATHMLNNKAELRAVQELLGHANIVTTQIYTYLSREHIHKVYDESHPRAKESRQVGK
jgi:site-specific recombinase XerD